MIQGIHKELILLHDFGEQQSAAARQRSRSCVCKLVAADFRHVPGSAGQSIFPAAPSGVHPIRRSDHIGFNSANLSLFNFEQLGKFPSIGFDRTGGDGAAVNYGRQLIGYKLK